MTTKKMTIAGALQYVLDNYELPEEVKEKITSTLATVEKRSARPKTEEEIKSKEEAIKAAMEVLSRTDKALTYSDFLITEKFMGWSTPKITRLLGDMVTSGKLLRETIKKKSYYRINGER